MNPKSTTAPCIAVVGPPNSGKTTLLSLLDEALQNHPDQPQAYVVKGSPDGTARYLSNAPELREKLKSIVKGAWSEETARIIRDWIDSCRSCLDLVLLDMGGKHDPKNDSILSRCSHYLVVSRLQDEEGRRSWSEVCEKHSLVGVGDVRSVIEAGEPGRIDGESSALLFRADPGLDSAVNRPIVAPILTRLLELRHEGTATGYLDLRLGRNWTFGDLVDLAGLDTALDRMITDQETVRLGGRAPVWAYGAALHRVLDRDLSKKIEIFDPKLPPGFLEIPRDLYRDPESPLAERLTVEWKASENGRASVLHVTARTGDRFLAPELAPLLPTIPTSAEAPPRPEAIVLSCPGPIWLHLADSRWLRSRYPEASLGFWDAGTRSAIFLTGPGAPRTEPWPLPFPGAEGQAAKS